MAINYSGAISGAQTFSVSDDPVAFTGNTTVGAGASITKTDTVGQTILMSNGVTVTISSTGFVAINGAFGIANLVIFDTADSDPKKGRWNYFSFNSSSSGSTMTHCLFKYAALGGGIIAQGGEFASGKFDYLIAYLGGGIIFGWISSSGSGTHVVSNTASIECTAMFAHNTTHTGSRTWNNVFMDGQRGSNLFSKDGSVAGLCAWNQAEPMNFAMSASNTATLTSVFLDLAHETGADGIQNSGAGDLTLTTFGIIGGRIAAYMSGAGTMTVDDGDVLKANFASGAIYRGAGTQSSDNVYLEANAGAGLANIDTTTDDSSDPNQYSVNTTRTNARTERFAKLDFTGITFSGVGDNGFTVNFTTGKKCKALVRWSVIDDGEYGNSTKYDVPQFIIPVPGSTIPIVVEQCLSGFTAADEVYSTSHAIPLTGVQAGQTVYMVLEAISINQEEFPTSAEQTQATTGGAGGGLLLHPGMNGGVRG